MKDFLENLSRYPRLLIAVSIGIFFVFFDWIKPLFKNPVTAVAITGILVGGFAFLYFTLEAMLGLNSL
jgi:hypothetical protein